MGWASGTEIFDGIVDAAINYIPVSNQRRVFKKIINAFEGADWDCQCESKYADHPIIGKLLNGE